MLLGLFVGSGWCYVEYFVFLLYSYSLWFLVLLVEILGVFVGLLMFVVFGYGVVVLCCVYCFGWGGVLWCGVLFSLVYFVVLLVGLIVMVVVIVVIV